MANCEAHYRYILNTASQHAALCRDLQNGRVPSRDRIRRDRLQSIAARRALTEELFEAFITPIDREDLFRVYETLADALCALQAVAVGGGVASCDVADALYEVTEAFVHGQTPQLLRAAARIYTRTADENTASPVGNWLSQCKRAARCMTAALLKNA